MQGQQHENRPAKTVTREELYDAVWSKTLKVLAQEWNTTYVQVVQACEELEVPRPGPGHWPLVARGFQVEREPLPEVTKNHPQELTLAAPGVRDRKRAASASPTLETHAEQPQLGGMAAEEGETEPAPAPAESQEDYLAKAAERAVLDIIRQAMKFDFWRESIRAYVSLGGLKAWLKLDEGFKAPEGKLVWCNSRSFTIADLFQDLVDPFGPDKRLRVLIVGSDIFLNRLDQLPHTFESTASDALTSDFSEPPLDQVEPG